MEPEGYDVLREAVWDKKEDAMSREELLARSNAWLAELRTELTDAGYSVHAPGASNPSGCDLYIKHIRIGESRFPAEEFETEVRVFVPKEARDKVTTVTCYVRDFARMIVQRPQDQPDECIAGVTRYTTTLSLDICRAMRKENFYTFVGMLCDIAQARDKIFADRCRTGYKFEPSSLGCLDTKTYRHVDAKLNNYIPETFDS